MRARLGYDESCKGFGIDASGIGRMGLRHGFPLRDDVTNSVHALTMGEGRMGMLVRHCWSNMRQASAEEIGPQVNSKAGISALQSEKQVTRGSLGKTLGRTTMRV